MVTTPDTIMELGRVSNMYLTHEFDEESISISTLLTFKIKFNADHCLGILIIKRLKIYAYNHRKIAVNLIELVKHDYP